MAEIRRYPFIRHLRCEAGSHVLHTRRDKVLHSGRGLAFFFQPMSDSLAEVPMEDREITVLFHGRSSDFQDLSAQVVLTYRTLDPQKLANRVDFGVDLRSGQWLKQPLEKLSSLFTQLVQQHAWITIARTPLKELLATGQEHIREQVETGLEGDLSLQEMGLRVVSVRVSSVKPNPDLEKAIEAPVREHIKQEADEAAFQRRALAVEKELAIQENELQNRIELAKREEQLIEQQGQNARRQAHEDAEAKRIAAESEAASQRLNTETSAAALKIHAEAESTGIRLRAEAEAESIKQVEGAKSDLERALLETYRTMPPMVLMGLAAKELGSKLRRIDHLNLGPDSLGPLLTNLLQAGTEHLEGRH
jgi:regulator of protease activity HflC (stomatin/prohibitin superfamily)